MIFATHLLAADVVSGPPPANGVHVVAASAGFLSYVLVWAAVMWGMFLRNGWSSTRVRHSTLYGAHMALGLTGLCLAAVHAFAQAAAPVTATRLVDVVVPFLNLDHPVLRDVPPLVRVGQGIGVLSLELMVAATLSLAIRHRLGQNRWRAVHMLNYAGFLLMVVHVLVSGNDAGHVWAWGTVLVTTAVTGITWAATTTWAGRARRTAERRLNVSRPGARLVVEVDPQLCARFGFCEHEAPSVFQLTGDGRLTYDASVPVELADPVVRAARVCPARAIRLGQDAAEVVMAPPAVPDDTGPHPVLPPVDLASRRLRR